MGLLVLDRAPAADDLLDLDQDSLCSCDHGSASHDPDGCRACLCPATWDGPGAEDLEAVELEADAVRVTAALVVARKLRKKLEQNRADSAANDPTRSPSALSRGSF